MTKMSSSEIERRKIAELARVYSERGYEVFTEGLGFTSPRPIRGIKPDLVVKKGKETIIIEVMTRDSPRKESDVVRQLAHYASDRPDIRFDLVVTNPKPESSPRFRDRLYRKQSEALQHSLFASIDEALELGRPDLVVVLGFPLVSALLARQAVKKGIPISPKDQDPLVLAERLAKRRAISKAVLDFVSDLRQKRNSVVHGRSRSVLRLEDAKEIRDRLASLAQQW